jgi:hypothetical protein
MSYAESHYFKTRGIFSFLRVVYKLPKRNLRQRIRYGKNGEIKKLTFGKN